MTDSIIEAKKHLKENYHKGTSCPCCNQFVKLYLFKMQASMAWVLIQLYNKRKEGERDGCWVHVIRVLKTNNGNYAKLRYWGLIKPFEGEEDPSIKASGFWKITDKGCRFVKGYNKLPSKAAIYNNKCYGLQGEDVSIKDVLGTKFNYNELMN